MSPENEASSLFSWQRLRSAEELGDFINRHLAALECITLED
jgi:hypothetical protein